MKKKDIKEEIFKCCDTIDDSELNSAEYKKALKNIKRLQEELLAAKILKS